MRKLFFVLLFLPLGLFAQSSNLFLINDQLTIADTGHVASSEIDTASRRISSSTNNLSGRFTLGFQVSVYNNLSSTDTLQMFVGTTAAFTAGAIVRIPPGQVFNSAYYKIRTGLNVYFRLPSTGGSPNNADFLFWIGGI